MHSWCHANYNTLVVRLGQKGLITPANSDASSGHTHTLSIRQSKGTAAPVPSPLIDAKGLVDGVCTGWVEASLVEGKPQVQPSGTCISGEGRVYD